MPEHKLNSPCNAPDWFNNEYCKNCHPKCPGSELDQIKCIVANVLYEVVNLSEYLCGKQWDEEAEAGTKQASEMAEKTEKP